MNPILFNTLPLCDKTHSYHEDSINKIILVMLTKGTLRY